MNTNELKSPSGSIPPRTTLSYSRDFIDVAALLRRFTKPELCAIAEAKDQGFNIDVLADAFGVLPTYDRYDEYPTLNDDDYDALTAVFAAWQREIRKR